MNFKWPQKTELGQIRRGVWLSAKQKQQKPGGNSVLYYPGTYLKFKGCYGSGSCLIIIHNVGAVINARRRGPPYTSSSATTQEYCTIANKLPAPSPRLSLLSSIANPSP